MRHIAFSLMTLLGLVSLAACTSVDAPTESNEAGFDGISAQGLAAELGTDEATADGIISALRGVREAWRENRPEQGERPNWLTAETFNREAARAEALERFDSRQDALEALQPRLQAVIDAVPADIRARLAERLDRPFRPRNRAARGERAERLGDGRARLAEELELTQDQREALADLRSDARTERQERDLPMRQLIQRALRSGDVSVQGLRTFWSETLRPAFAERLDRKLDHVASLREILTAEQREKLVELRKDRQERAEERRGDRQAEREETRGR